MARSFYRPGPENTGVDFTRVNTYYHKPSDSYFSMLQRDGKYYQRRYQLDTSGHQINVMEKQIDYVMGSGNNARTYLYRTPANTLMELPLGWYAEKGGYLAMNPGYDRPAHDGFRRPITYDCMFCHNAYPKIPAGHEQPYAEPVYDATLPEGIDCQRCHGSATRHMQLAATRGAKTEEVRRAIVNPARLSQERQMETCMACHLESTSFPLPNAVQRFERSTFSYPPGEPLQDFIVNFDHAPAANRQDKFEIVSSAYRLRLSKCFQKSNGKMLCTTCHNPHNAPRGAAADRQYTAACRQCHTQAFDRLVQSGKHTAENGCVGCHMPKRRTEDVIHAAMNDHLIQRQKPSGDLLRERGEHQDVYRGAVALLYPATLPKSGENELLLAVAQVIQQSNLNQGIAQLTAAIDKYKPQRAEYYLQLAEALQNNGQLAKAVPIYREAVKHNPDSAVMLQKLGTALRRLGQNEEAADVLRRASSIDPARPLTWHELGITYRALGKDADAISAITKALEIDPELPEAHNNLGNLKFAAGQTDRAESAFREAIRIRPEFADAHGNLASLLSVAGRFAEAQQEFAVALRYQPSDAPTRYNYAMMLGRNSHFDEAQRQLESSLQAEPNFADAQLLLGDLLMARQHASDAIPHYREALRIHPESGRAHLGLGAALSSTGNLQEGMAQLHAAAVSSDNSVREQATELLRQIEKRP